MLNYFKEKSCSICDFNETKLEQESSVTGENKILYTDVIKV